MKIENYEFNKSSFLSVEKDMSLIVNKLLENNNLKKLLYYTTPDALTRPNLTEEESIGLFGPNIRIVPKITVDSDVLAYIIISFDNFMTNPENPEFRDNIICFDIICHLNQWLLKDFQLRPYRIAAEIDKMLDKKHLTGIGKLDYLGTNQMLISDEFAGLSLMYRAIHGNEDKIHALSPEEEEILFGKSDE